MSEAGGVDLSGKGLKVFEERRTKIFLMILFATTLVFILDMTILFSIQEDFPVSHDSKEKVEEWDFSSEEFLNFEW